MAGEERFLGPAFRLPQPSSARSDHPAEPRHTRDIDARRVRHRLTACPEIDCLRHRLPPGTLAAAELRAAEIGIGADRVLISAGIISEADYAIALAHHIGIGFDRLETFVRSDCPISDDDLPDCARAGLIRLRTDEADILAIAPHGDGARQLINAIALDPSLAPQVRITTRASIERYLYLYAPAAIGRRAAFFLKATDPHFSAAGTGARSLFAGALCLCAIAIFAPKIVAYTFDVILALIFLGWIVLRLLGTLTTGIMWRRRVALKESELPPYTVIVALYRETKALPHLIRSLSALDYPHEKLEIKLVIEPDDWDMQAALGATDLDSRFEIIVAPAVGPRTKPKALNAALPFSRGTFIAVYDAEDRPEPDQLRRAVQAFAVADDGLACVQARLTIDNSRDSILTRLFTAEYSGLFDVFLPGIAAWRSPLPLGGSSNHFRASALRDVGAWDPYNVTEDADLGMRLSRFGYRAAVIDSATYEEVT